MFYFIETSLVIHVLLDLRSFDVGEYSLHVTVAQSSPVPLSGMKQRIKDDVELGASTCENLVSFEISHMLFRGTLHLQVKLMSLSRRGPCEDTHL